jgi:hypothetical protein
MLASWLFDLNQSDARAEQIGCEKSESETKAEFVFVGGVSTEFVFVEGASMSLASKRLAGRPQ